MRVDERDGVRGTWWESKMARCDCCRFQPAQCAAAAPAGQVGCIYREEPARLPGKLNTINEDDQGIGMGWE